ncbi:MAG: 3-phosphoshikimate 1-carboxyvinyltransferase [Xanthomonadales bacterium]|jgi:3-phosphoshikimate 1-carboxyvinyltransferase|nr:3-phosphoshikimate 1-carboxyvinyltransferase [Xanthomonadales bacterium]
MILKTAAARAPLRGELTPPGDKSISHRSLIFGCLACGETRVEGLLESEDVNATAEACRQLGMSMNREGDVLVLEGVGDRGLSAPSADLDMGNSGTAMRLLAGVLAAQPFDSTLVGDQSLSQRPMQRIVTPLRMMGADIETGRDGTPPLRIRGVPGGLQGIAYDSPVASAQVKSCLLLAGLYARGRTTVNEPLRSRDHSERMLPAFGVELLGDCGVVGGSRLTGTSLRVPADISSAAFFLVAAALVPGSELLLKNVGLNETRDGIVHVMRAMGADLTVESARVSGGEKVADLRIRYAGRLRGTVIPVDIVPSLIDELPVILALAACCEGTTRLRGAAELRVKESDRLAVMARGLERLGVKLEEFEDGMDVHGGSVGGGEVDGAGDHRCAMSFCVLGQVASGPVTVNGCHNINTSYPGFVSDLSGLGGNVAPGNCSAGAVS